MTKWEKQPLRFSLATLLVVVLVTASYIAVVAGFLGWYTHHRWHQRRIAALQQELTQTSAQLAQLQRAMARAQLDDAKVSDPLNRRLIEDQANIETFNDRGQIRDMTFENAAFTDRQLDQILAVKSLERVDLRGTGITDAGLARLKELPNLKCLILWSTNISDRGLAHVVQIKTIRQLAIPGSISDDGMVLLRQLPNLEFLDLQECVDLGAEGFKNVEQLKQLKTVMLNRTFPPPQNSIARLREALPSCRIHN